MTERKYSLSEIDEMRDNIVRREIDLETVRTSGGYQMNKLRERAEDMLRTYMMAGTDPEEVKKSAEEAAEEVDKYWDKREQPVA